MPNMPTAEIIHSATPLETRFVGVHPRLYATAEKIATLREKCGREPWASFLKRVCRVGARHMGDDLSVTLTGGDVRGAGCRLANLAVAYRLTGEPAYLDYAIAHLDAMCAIEDWSVSLQFGHWAHGAALAYDWLYDQLDEPLRDRIRRTLLARANRVVDRWMLYGSLYPTGYAWNHSGVTHNGIMAIGCVLFGEVEGAAALVQFSLEKLRLMVDALGDDGASAEGLAYGQYHIDFHLKSLIFAEQLLGEDFFAEHRFLPRLPRFLLYSTLPRDAWQPDAMFMQFGDTDGPHWYGPDSHLRVVAARYRDAHAQWLADAVAEAGTAGETSCFLNLLFYDETVVPVAPDTLPDTCHFTDKDIVFMRSGWQDGAAVAGFKCGPASGHHAARHYRNNVAGGHMHPDAGHLLLHAGGDWLLHDTGYSLKFTAYRNTILVNGIGQTGEGGVWFEDLEIRRGKPEGRILRVASTPQTTMVIADVAPAYEKTAGLKRFFRHLLYLKPDIWILVDELETEKPAVFEQRFHSPGGFTAMDERDWLACGQKTALRLAPLGPLPVQVRALAEPVRNCPGRSSGRLEKDPIETLLITNPEPVCQALLVTVLQVYPLAAPSVLALTMEPQGDSYDIRLQEGQRSLRVGFVAAQSDPSLGIFTLYPDR